MTHMHIQKTNQLVSQIASIYEICNVYTVIGNVFLFINVVYFYVYCVSKEAYIWLTTCLGSGAE